MVLTQNSRLSPLKIVEEVFNSITHGLGAIFAVVGVIVILLTSQATPSLRVSFIIYGLSLVTLMTISSLYHALKFTKASKVFQILDHGSIFLLIAGSFTPFVVAMYEGWAQLLILAFVWSLAIAGIVLKATIPTTMDKLGAGVYIALGWLALVFIPKLGILPSQVIWLVAIGGVLYTAGAGLLAFKKPFAHVAWHVFVVAAATTHYFAITMLA